MRIRIKYRRQSPCQPELEVFRSIVVPRQSKWLPTAASVMVHLMVLGLLSAFAGETNWGEDKIDWSRYTLETIRLQSPDPIYFPTGGSHPAETTGSGLRQSTHSSATAAAGSSEPKAMSTASARLELPEVREIRKEAVTIIEPDFHPQRPLPNNVPTLAFWAAQQPERPKPARKILTPGSPEKAASRPMLDAAPLPEIPNRQPVAADLNVALSRTLPAPALPLAPSTTAPIRLRDRTPVAAGPSFDTSPGEPVNVIAISRDRAPARIVELVAGLQNAPAASGVAGSGGGASGGSNSDAAKSPSTSPSAGQQPAASSTVRNDPASPRGVTATGPAATADRLVQSAAGIVNPDRDHASGRSTSAVTRIAHPVNGVFDVVIMQSATRDDLPELRGLLSGNPVYSVYLPVGAEKEWLLQYCLPGRGRSGDSVYQVNIDDSTGISPPYPVVTVIPNNILGVTHPKQIVLHGVLTLAGTLREVKATDGANTLAGQILSLLGDWRFRPALKNKLPVDIEVIIIIPPVG